MEGNVHCDVGLNVLLFDWFRTLRECRDFVLDGMLARVVRDLHV